MNNVHVTPRNEALNVLDDFRMYCVLIEKSTFKTVE